MGNSPDHRSLRLLFLLCFLGRSPDHRSLRLLSIHCFLGRSPDHRSLRLPSIHCFLGRSPDHRSLRLLSVLCPLRRAEADTDGYAVGCHRSGADRGAHLPGVADGRPGVEDPPPPQAQGNPQLSLQPGHAGRPSAFPANQERVASCRAAFPSRRAVPSGRRCTCPT